MVSWLLEPLSDLFVLSIIHFYRKRFELSGFQIVLGFWILIQAAASASASDGGSASAALAALASGVEASAGAGSASSAVQSRPFSVSSASATSVSRAGSVASASTGGSAFAQSSAEMSSLTSKFFEQQRRCRAQSVQRFAREFEVQTELLEDVPAVREIGLWNGRIAMVPFYLFEG